MDVPSTVSDARPVKILVVDDRPENRLAVRAMLSSPDYELVEATNGQQALLALLRDDFALLLLDVVMAGMSGFELATLVKERARTATVPILFMTAEARDVELIYRAYRIGAVDYLTMPLNAEMVRAKVAVFADLYRQRRRIEEQSARLVEAERKESELRLLELRMASERHYRSLSDAMPHIVWTARPDGMVDSLNQRWFEYTGIAADRTRGSWLGAVHPEDLPACRERWDASLRSGATFQTECRLHRKSDGEFRWHLARAVPERGPAGAIVSWLGTFTDIEDQKRAQAALADFKDTLDAVIDCVLILDPLRGQVLYVNRGASLLLGYDHDELLRMRPPDFMTEYDEASLRELVAPVGDRGPSLTVETRFRRSDGRQVPVEVSLQHVGLRDSRVVAIARDITERKRAQLERELLYREAVDAVRSRDDFLSVASHELKTPVTSLKLGVDTLLRWFHTRAGQVRLPDEVGGRLELIARQIDRLSQLVAELLDVSRITAGRLEIQAEPLDLTELARDVLARTADDAARAQCDVSLHAAGPVTGRWDRLRLDQVLTNLLTNAFKYGAGRPVEVTITATPEQAALAVRDHGIGVAPEDAERIFARFERARSARGYGGLGLGLYITRQIVEAHGGHVRVESQPGAGSTFTVELPRQPPVTAAAPEASLPSSEPAPGRP